MIASLIVATARVLSGAQVRWVGCDPSVRQRIYFANHTSHLDFVVLWSALPPVLRRLTRPVAGRDYWEPNALRRYLAARVFQAVLVDRQEATAGAATDRAARVAGARRTVQVTAQALGTKHSLIVFPEGTRGSGAEPGPFKSGLYHLAQLRPDVELIPAYLENLNRILPKGEILPVPMMASVTFGAPLLLEPGEAREAFLARARTALLELRRS
jgi:1-acyl-sn-glycerol-3-phosphate acyltransferase